MGFFSLWRNWEAFKVPLAEAFAGPRRRARRTCHPLKKHFQHVQELVCRNLLLLLLRIWGQLAGVPHQNYPDHRARLGLVRCLTYIVKPNRLELEISYWITNLSLWLVSRSTAPGVLNIRLWPFCNEIPKEAEAQILAGLQGQRAWVGAFTLSLAVFFFHQSWVLGSLKACQGLHFNFAMMFVRHSGLLEGLLCTY